MILNPAWKGRRYAVLGLARSGKATVEALLASGAEVLAWDDRAEAREPFAGRAALAENMTRHRGARARHAEVVAGVARHLATTGRVVFTELAMRTARDKELSMPRLILPSVQVNMRAGNLPPPADNGTRYLKLPLDAL